MHGFAYVFSICHFAVVIHYRLLYVQNSPLVPVYPQPAIQHSVDGSKMSLALGSFTFLTLAQVSIFVFNFTRAMSF